MRRLAYIVFFLLCSVIGSYQAHAQFWDGLPPATLPLSPNDIVAVCQGGTPGHFGTCNVHQAAVSNFGISTSAAAVATNAALKAYSVATILAGTTIERLGFITEGDGGALVYQFSSLACTLNGGAGDNGAQVAPTTGTGCWKADFSQIPANVKQWGALGNGTTDDTAALQAALSYTAGIMRLSGPAGVFRSATGITLPDNTDLEGLTYTQGSIPTGFVIQCDLSVAVCINANGNDNAAITLKRVIQSRASGTIPTSNAVGIQITGADGVILEDLSAQRDSAAYNFVGGNARGTILQANRITSCAVTDSHVIINGWAVARFNQSYFGCNGAYDQPSNNFVKITGGDNTVGPNTIEFANSQFNQGQNVATCGISFASLGAGQGTAIQDFVFIGDHFETDQNLVCSDSTVTDIENFTIQNMWANGGWGGSNHLLALNAATVPNDWRVSGSKFDGWTDVILAPSAIMTAVQFNNNIFFQPVRVTGVGNSTVSFAENRFLGLTVSGAFAAARFTGTSAGGTYTNTSGSIVATNLPMWVSYSPVISGAGGSGTPTYALQYGEWQTDGSTVKTHFTVVYSGAASGYSGNMAVSLPTSVVGGAAANQGECVFSNWGGITLDAGYTDIAGSIAPSAGAAAFVENGSGKNTGIVQGASFNGGITGVAGSCSYRIQ